MTLRGVRDFLFVRIVSAIATLVIRLLCWTVRVRELGPPEPDGPVLYAFHHGRQFGLLRYRPARGAAVLSSLSRDGRLQARILTALGFAVVAGSSTRAGVSGLRGLLRHVRAGRRAGFAVDGPRGPLGVVKPGVVALARQTGAPIVPVSFAARGHVFERAWDQYLLPRPFARGVVLRGDPIAVPRHATEEELEERRQLLERTLWDLDRRAEAEQ